jgi:hypothetical protein
MANAWDDWLRRARHDLVKRLLWPARDRRDMGGDVRPGELVVALVDDEGQPTTAAALWASLCQDAPVPAHPALAEFTPALLSAVAAARRDDLTSVLALDEAFARLGQQLAEPAQEDR